ncbi:nitroreductase/quinone reductase family protein [Ruania alba]|uniref:Deazaflavin-dependent oxidoreductase, nitroreductase family n=1 Tax=Ruania alba TaxID=648782 RepID=A0A1H5MYI9_9MICO|nr:nitroreductase/quinone reductase family protein [Ruania alba]SEE94343.1 deazaflavin-dependent oxidoreductase, nitroreductase family [Ruania alba]
MSVMKVVNLVPSLLLHLPLLHRVLSGRYLILEFTGRRSGRRFRTPVAYVRDGSAVLMSTDSPWWRNVASNPGVGLRLRGREVSGTASVIDDGHAARAHLARLSTIPGYAKAAGLERVGGQVPAMAIAEALDSGRRVIRIEVAA